MRLRAARATTDVDVLFRRYPLIPRCMRLDEDIAYIPAAATYTSVQGRFIVPFLNHPTLEAVRAELYWHLKDAGALYAEP